MAKGWQPAPQMPDHDTVTGVMDTLVIEVKETGDAMFDIRLTDEHTVETPERVGVGGWSGGTICALSLALRQLDGIQTHTVRTERSRSSTGREPW